VLGADGTVYVGSDDNNIYAIDSAGNLKWKYKTEGPVNSSPVLGADGTVYVGSDDNNIYAIDSAGNLKWKYATNYWVKSSPVLGSDGTVYVGSFDGNIYAIDSAGNLKWKYKTEGPVWSSPVLGTDGTVYVGSRDNCTYAIYTGVNCSCPAGTFLNATSLFASCYALETVCLLCPKGSYCPYLRSAASSPVRCPSGSFCNSTGMAAPIPCPAGHYNPNPGADNSASCRKCFSRTSCFPYGQPAQRPCPSGTYCPSPGDEPKPCPAGSYNSAVGGTTVDDCKPCTLGHFCPQRSTQPQPCDTGKFSEKTGQSLCVACPEDFVALSAGAVFCTPCGTGLTSSPDFTRCEKCLPSYFKPSTYKCYTPLELAFVILSFIVSVLSSLFSLNKLRIFVQERVQKLKAASIKPTLKRVVFMQRALVNQSKLMLLSLADKTGADHDETRPASNEAVVQLMRNVQRQLQEQQQQFHQLQQNLQEQLQQQQQMIHQLTQQLQRLQ
jgi:hypothetical protein